jgi:hypothetical protein
VVFVYDPGAGTLDLFAKGDRKLKLELRRIFCAVILREEGEIGQCADAAYELDELLRRDFPFPTDPQDGIEEVRVRALRLTFVDGGRRITLEADPKARPEDVHDMLDEYLNDKCLSEQGVKVTWVNFQFLLGGSGRRRRKNMTFDVTYPDSSTLKSLSEAHKLLGEKYLKRWGIARA